MKTALLLMMLVAGCSETTASVRHEEPSVDVVITATKPPHLTFHADTGFTVAERDSIQHGANDWRGQTSDLAQIELVWDLDFASISNLAFHRRMHHNLLVRHVSTDGAVTSDDGGVLGRMTQGGIYNVSGEALEGFFVMDRLAETDYFGQVILHEFGHALGLGHISNKSAMMYEHTAKGRTPCLKKDDLQEFCRVNYCGLTPLFPCE